MSLEPLLSLRRHIGEVACNSLLRLVRGPCCSAQSLKATAGERKSFCKVSIYNAVRGKGGHCTLLEACPEKSKEERQERKFLRMIGLRKNAKTKDKRRYALLYCPLCAETHSCRTA
ncbi:hypothetical protein NQZ68_036747 [Dissostichus eleginoides]|nr:hypothetical protein NQZ68_036747 [Dissostichus eleginoides]